MKNLTIIVLILFFGISGNAQDKIQNYLPQSAQKLGKKNANYLLFTLKNVSANTKDFSNIQKLDSLTEISNKNFENKFREKLPATELKAIQFKDYLTIIEDPFLKEILQQISSAIYNSKNFTDFSQKLSSIASNKAIKKLNKKDQFLIYNEISCLYYTTKGLAASTIIQNNGAAKINWGKIWNGIKCAAGIVGGAIGGSLGGASAGSAVPILGTVVGAFLGGIGGALTGVSRC